jgi:tRNA threonylcarbamoyladenosine biosynthesis protein TsaE
MKFTIPSLNELSSVAAEFLKHAGNKKQFAFYGSMGVGKTTFIKALCSRLDVVEVVTSPTFAIVNEYHTKAGDLVYHFDFYRIRKLEELYDLGYEDYLYSANYCFIEWPELGEEVLPDHLVKVTMDQLPDGSRIIEVAN